MYVTIDSEVDGQRITTLYAHLHAGSVTVRAGQHVRGGTGRGRRLHGALSSDSIVSMVEAGIHAGIQAAWESSDPENTPRHDQTREYRTTWADDHDFEHVHVETNATLDDVRRYAEKVSIELAPTVVVARIVNEWRAAPGPEFE